MANLFKEENTELWTNPFSDWVGRGCGEEFQIPQDEPMEAKQKRFEERKLYDGQSLHSQMIKAQQQGEHLRFIVEAAADGSSLVVGNQWMPTWMKKKQEEKTCVKLSDGFEMAKMYVIVGKYKKRKLGNTLDTWKKFQIVKHRKEASAEEKMMKIAVKVSRIRNGST